MIVKVWSTFTNTCADVHQRQTHLIYVYGVVSYSALAQHGSANEWRRYKVKPYIIGWGQT